MNQCLETATCKQICRTQYKNIFKGAAQQMTEWTTMWQNTVKNPYLS